jgi:ATP-dependent Clp protease ATP-binding subunit ClpA
MTDNMERFTNDAQTAFFRAQRLAERQRKTYIGTEHLLAALLADFGSAKQILLSLGITKALVKEIIIEIESGKYVPLRHPLDAARLSEGIQRVIQIAVEEARRSKHKRVRSEHLLLGLLLYEDNALDILKRLGVEQEKTVEHTRTILSQVAGDAEIVEQLTNILSTTPLAQKRRFSVVITDNKTNLVHETIDLTLSELVKFTIQFLNKVLVDGETGGVFEITGKNVNINVDISAIGEIA